ncbi:MAG: EAL domain-containing protein [Geminicoccaceae bacterium]|nr:EAL domain-containing protein [Geminicoccaceae bacterium]
MRSTRLRWGGYVVLLIAFTTGSMLVWSSIDRMRDEVRRGGIEINGIGDVFWLEREFHRLREDVAMFGTGGGDIGRDDLFLRLELLWSRCRLVMEAQTLAHVRADHPVTPLARALLLALEEVERRLSSLDEGDGAGAQAILALLDPFAAPVQQLSVDVEALLDATTQHLSSKFAGLLNGLDSLAIGAGMASLTLLAMFVIEAAVARRAREAIVERERALRHLAYNDPLTGLANRRNMVEHLPVALDRARGDGRGVALMVVDLDGFKPINDNHGHEVGDALLVEIARRLGRLSRPHDFCARMGGDEFVFVLAGIVGESEAFCIADRILEEIRQPARVRGVEASVGASIGLALFPDDADDADALYRKADMALFSAKSAGRGKIRRYDRGIHEGIERRKSIEDRLRSALAEGGLEMFYQPQVVLADGRPDAVEALIRWHDAKLGPVAPGEFIAIAEDAGLIGEVDAWVLATVVARAARWTGAAGQLRVAINLSARMFGQDDLCDVVLGHLSAAGMDPGRLELEITETAVLAHTETTLTQLRRLRSHGVRIAVDDFGVGYSSLNYLKRLPIDQLKIDRSFVADIERDGDDRAIIGAIRSVAAALHLDVVAEGIETRAQEHYLRSIGCERGQGFLYARPMPEGDLLAHLEKRASNTRLPAAEPAHGAFT